MYLRVLILIKQNKKCTYVMYTFTCKFSIEIKLSQIHY